MSDLIPKIAPPPPWPKEKRAVAFFSSMMMGGAERQMASLAVGLAEAGYHCTVFSHGPKYRSGPCFSILEDTEVHTVSTDKPPCLDGYDILITWGVDVLHTKVHNIPQVYIVHSDGEDTGLMLQRCKHRIHNPVAVSTPAAELTQHVTGKKTEVIWNGADHIIPRGRLPQLHGGDSFIMGFLGRYAPEKNLTVAVDALTLLPDNYRLRLYGYGSTAEELKHRAARKNVDFRLDVCGVVTDLSRAYGELDCLILTSLYEGFPMVVCEAMLAGVPVVAVPHGDLPLMLHDLHLGIPIHPTPESLASGVIRLTDWPVETIKMRARALRFAREHLTAEAMCRRYADKIERVLNGQD